MSAAPSAAAVLLDALAQAGVVLALAEGERVRWSAPAGVMTPTLLAELRRHKCEVLAVLTAEAGDTASRTSTRAREGRECALGAPAAAGADSNLATEAIEERAAVLQYDAGLPRAWAEGASRLLAGLPPPAGCAPWRWDQVCDDAAALIADRWAAKAAALGWQGAELFGAMPAYSDVRYDAQGLAWLLHGRTVVSLDAAGADMRTVGGAVLRFHRRPAGDRAPPKSVPAWELREHPEFCAPKKGTGARHG
jgi:hypothetical protein